MLRIGQSFGGVGVSAPERLQPELEVIGNHSRAAVRPWVISVDQRGLAVSFFALWVFKSKSLLSSEGQS